MKNSKPIVIIVLMAILLFLIILNLVLNKKQAPVEHFQATEQVGSGSMDMGETYDLKEYASNTEKLEDMFSSLKSAEDKCRQLEHTQVAREEEEMMRENDRIYKELKEQDKKIHELKEIVKYLTIEKKRRDKINKNCMHNKQRKLNDNYNIVKSLSEDGFLRDNTVDIDLNVSESEKMKNFLSSVNNNKKAMPEDTSDNNKSLKCNRGGSSDIDLSEITDKCYGCDADKLKENENYIRKDFE